TALLTGTELAELHRERILPRSQATKCAPAMPLERNPISRLPIPSTSPRPPGANMARSHPRRRGDRMIATMKHREFIDLERIEREHIQNSGPFQKLRPPTLTSASMVTRTAARARVRPLSRVR